VKPCATSDYPTPARRPAYSVLDLTKTEQAVGPMPQWRANVDEVVDALQGRPA
jgi:dTDP-4-dehydrorhamnose reductase